MPFSAETKEVLKIAEEEAAALGNDWVGTEHLLLAIIRVGDPIAAGTLRDLCGTLENVRSRVSGRRRELGDRHEGGPSGTSSEFDQGFEDLVSGRRPAWHAVGHDRQRLIDACHDWLTPARLHASNLDDPSPDRATWILDRLLPQDEGDVFRRLNGFERWLYTLYPLFRRSPEDLDSVTPKRFGDGESIAVEAAWAETRASDDELLGWQAECERRGWPNVGRNIVPVVEYCRCAPSLDRIASYLKWAPRQEVRILLHQAMRQVADALPRTEKPELGIEARLREAGFDELAQAMGGRVKAGRPAPMTDMKARMAAAEAAALRPSEGDLWEPEFAETLWTAQQGWEDVERLVGAGARVAAWRLVEVVPRDGADIWKRALGYSDGSSISALCEWCSPAERELLVPHFDHEDIEWAACALCMRRPN
jgi:hypothetical protein